MKQEHSKMKTNRRKKQQNYNQMLKRQVTTIIQTAIHSQCSSHTKTGLIYHHVFAASAITKKVN